MLSYRVSFFFVLPFICKSSDLELHIFALCLGRAAENLGSGSYINPQIARKCGFVYGEKAI